MNNLLKKIEEATKEKAVLLHERELGTGKRYQIALVDDEYGVELILSLAYSYNDLGYYFWYIEDVCSVSKFYYCIYDYTIDKIKEVLNDKNHH